MLFSSGESAEAENKFSMTESPHFELSDSLQVAGNELAIRFNS
jgi:hypothetical protein